MTLLMDTLFFESHLYTTANAGANLFGKDSMEQH
jgi:hypothetical protein